MEDFLDPLAPSWYIYPINKGEMPPTKGNQMTPKELAQELDSDPKQVRKFLRSLTTDRAGKGGRWVIEDSDLPMLKERFANWNSRSTTTLSISDLD